MRINNMLVDMVLQREKDHRLTPEKPLRLPLLKEVTEIYLMTRDQQIREGNHIERTRKTTKKTTLRGSPTGQGSSELHGGRTFK